jgi:hypothetical protein
MEVPVVTHAESDFDPQFAKALSQAGPEAGEFAFERRGSGDSNYPMHAVILAVDEKAGVIILRRTRTHAGRVQEMGLRYFLTATTPQGVQLVNRVAVERDRKFRDKQKARETAVATALTSPSHRAAASPTKSAFGGSSQITLDGYKLRTFLFYDQENPQRCVVLTAKSLSAAQQFIAMQDLYLTLDDLLWDAINAHVLWPGGIQCDRLVNAEAWSVDWVSIFDELQGLPPNVLSSYFKAVRSSADWPKMPDLTGDGIASLTARGLLKLEPEPQSLRDILERIPTIAALRNLVKTTGAKPSGTTRVVLNAQLLALQTPPLVNAARQLMRPARPIVCGPCGLTPWEFRSALLEMRDSIFMMRLWLRGEPDRFSDHEEEMLSASERLV